VNALDLVLTTVNGGGNPRTVSKNTALTRGEVAVFLGKWSYVEPEWNSRFTYDDTGSHWSAGYVNALYRRGILYEDGRFFYPDRKIRKDELCVYLDRLLVLPDTINFHAFSFRDVPMSSPAYNSISKLCYFNVVSGQNKNFFRPEEDVTASDLSVIVEQIKRYEYPINPDRPKERSHYRPTGPIDPEEHAPYINPR